MKTLGVTVIDRVFVVVYRTANPTDDEWADYLDLVERHGIERTMQLILTDGGEPTPAQRRRLNHLLGGRTVPVAVVSGSRRVRGTVTALSWFSFNRKLKAFPPTELHEAIAWLEIPATRTVLIAREIIRVRAELEGVP